MNEIEEYQEMKNISTEARQKLFNGLMIRLKSARTREDELSKEWLQTMNHLRGI